jgi:tetratricopeptide (TPR) repeat protein
MSFRLLLPVGCAIALACAPALGQTDSPDGEAVIRFFLSESRESPITLPHQKVSDEYARRHREWSQRVLAGPFGARSHGKAWEAEAQTFVNAALTYWLKGTSVPASQILSRQARDLVDAGCEDQLVLFLAAVVHRRKDQDKQICAKSYESALKQVQSGPDSLTPLGWFTMLGVRHMRVDAGQKVDDLDRQLIECSRAMLGNDSYSKDEADLYVRHHDVRDASQFIVQNSSVLLPIYRDSPLPEWARLTLVGICETGMGWKRRGDGWNYTVTRDGWKALAEHLALARKALEQAWELRPDVPVAAAQMIVVAMGEETPKAENRMWFDRVVAADPFYDEAYDSLLYSYRPRWSGSHSRMLDFGRACMATKRYDTDIPLNFFRACNVIAKEKLDWRPIFRSPEIAQPYMELSHALVEAPDRFDEQRLRLSYLAVNAWITGDYELAARTLEQIDGPLEQEAQDKLGDFDSNEEDFRAEVAILGGPARAEFEQGDTHTAAGEYDLARKAYENTLSKSPDHTHPLIEGRISVLEVETGLESGEWVALKGKPQLGAWMVRQGRWRGSDNGALVIDGDGIRGLLIHRARIGPNFEMRGTFSISDPARNGQNLNVAWGWHIDRYDRYFGAGLFQKKASNPTANLWTKDTDAKEKGAVVSLKPANQFFLRVAEGRVTFELNGRRIHDNIQPKVVTGGPEDGRVGLSAYAFATGTTTRIASLEVRRVKP